MKKYCILFTLVLFGLTGSIEAEEIPLSEIIAYSYSSGGSWNAETGEFVIPVDEVGWHYSLRFVRPVAKGEIYVAYLMSDPVESKVKGSIDMRLDSSDYLSYARGEIDQYDDYNFAVLVSDTTDQNSRIVFNFQAMESVSTIKVKKIIFEKAQFTNKTTVSLHYPYLKHFTYQGAGTWDEMTKTITTISGTEYWHNYLYTAKEIFKDHVYRIRIQTRSSTDGYSGRILFEDDDPVYHSYSKEAEVNWAEPIDVFLTAEYPNFHDLLSDPDGFRGSILRFDFGASIGSCVIEQIKISELVMQEKIKKVENRHLPAVYNLLLLENK